MVCIYCKSNIWRVCMGYSMDLFWIKSLNVSSVFSIQRPSGWGGGGGGGLVYQDSPYHGNISI